VNIHFAAAWLRSLQTSPEDSLTFYAERFEIMNPPLGIYIRDDRAALARVLAPLSNLDPDNGAGIHQLAAEEYIGDQNSGLVLWQWGVVGARRFLGLPTNGAPAFTAGMSFLIYENGKIAREIVHCDQRHPALRLGLPLARSN